MNQIIIYTNDKGGVSLCVPTGELSIEEVKAKDTPEHSIIVDADTLPNADNDFFDAWELNNGTVAVNIDKAKNITKNRLRAERAPLLAAQDVLFQRAQETGADTKAIVAEKQRLRDITKLVDLYSTTADFRKLNCQSVAPAPQPAPATPQPAAQPAPQPAPQPAAQPAPTATTTTQTATAQPAPSTGA